MCCAIFRCDGARGILSGCCGWAVGVSGWCLMWLVLYWIVVRFVLSVLLAD